MHCFINPKQVQKPFIYLAVVVSKPHSSLSQQNDIKIKQVLARLLALFLFTTR